MADISGSLLTWHWPSIVWITVIVDIVLFEYVEERVIIIHILKKQTVTLTKLYMNAQTNKAVTDDT